MPEFPDISIVTANYNRKAVLLRSLEFLARQDFSADRFEVIVVDDGSDDGSREAVSGMISEVPYSLRLLVQDHAGPGAAHNHGVREARAPVVLFLANDMFASPSLVRSHYEMHRKHPEEWIAVVGNLRESPELPETAFHKAWDPFRRWNPERGEELGEFDFWVSNLSLKKTFFLRHGVFFEYPEPAMEDLELAYRLFRQGLKLLYCREALADHYHPQTIDSVINRVYTTGRNFHLYESRVPHNRCHEFAKILSKRLGPRLFLRVLCRDMVRLTFFNRFTIPGIVVPLIRRAENNRLLEPLVGFLEQRASGYYFRKGVRDGMKERQRRAHEAGT